MNNRLWPSRSHHIFNNAPVLAFLNRIAVIFGMSLSCSNCISRRPCHTSECRVIWSIAPPPDASHAQWGLSLVQRFIARSFVKNANEIKTARCKTQEKWRFPFFKSVCQMNAKLSFNRTSFPFIRNPPAFCVYNFLVCQATKVMMTRYQKSFVPTAAKIVNSNFKR